MSDIFFQHAIDSYIKDLLKQMWYAYWEDIVSSVAEYGLKCDESDIRESLDRLTEEGYLQYHADYWALGVLSRRDLKRWCGGY